MAVSSPKASSRAGVLRLLGLDRDPWFMTTGTRQYSLSHIRYLEAESIHVLREVAAEFERPVLLYSVGKDSSCLLRLCQKAFHPGKLPFPLMHVDTGFKFSEMYDFRDRSRRGRRGLDCLAERGGDRRGCQPVRSRHPALLRVPQDRGVAHRSAPPTSMPPSAGRGGTKRSPARRSACSRFATTSVSGTPGRSGRSRGISTTPASMCGSRPRVPAVQLD